MEEVRIKCTHAHKTIGQLYDVVNDILNADYNADFKLVKFFQYISEYFRFPVALNDIQ